MPSNQMTNFRWYRWRCSRNLRMLWFNWQILKCPDSICLQGRVNDQQHLTLNLKLNPERMRLFSQKNYLVFLTKIQPSDKKLRGFELTWCRLKILLEQNKNHLYINKRASRGWKIFPLEAVRGGQGAEETQGWLHQLWNAWVASTKSEEYDRYELGPLSSWKEYALTAARDWESNILADDWRRTRSTRLKTDSV